MESSGPEEDENTKKKIMKDAINFFRLEKLEKEIIDTTIKDARNFF